jgi:hypothetical protein
LTSRLAGPTRLLRPGLAGAITAATAAGLALGWAAAGLAPRPTAAGTSVGLAGLALVLAAANGYGKAYSP